MMKGQWLLTPVVFQTIQWNAEEMLQMSLEVFVAGDDFGFSSSYSGDAVCKYRVDRYYIMAYATPVQVQFFKLFLKHRCIDAN